MQIFSARKMHADTARVSAVDDDDDDARVQQNRYHNKWKGWWYSVGRTFVSENANPRARQHSRKL